MANSVSMRFNRKGKMAILKSPGVKLRLKMHCDNIKRRADAMSESGVANYQVVIDTHSVAAHGHVWARDAATIASNAKHDALVQQLAKEGGVTMHE